MRLVYLDTSVALAHFLGEDVEPPEGLWKEALVSSRLLAYEMWTRLDAMGLRESHGRGARELLARVGMLELVEPILGRALEGYPVPVRTLDALHLASILFLGEQGHAVHLASYDRRLAGAARALGVELWEGGLTSP